MLVASHLTGYSAVRGFTVAAAAPSIAMEETSFTVSGRGWGHGIGMSQWGAYGLAKQGSSYKTILKHVALESYLRGVVPYEVSASWPAESLKAQACAARSYAERARRVATGQWDLYCDVRSQAYGGMSREDSRTDAAIKATAGVVPSYAGEPIQAFYSSSSGGHTESIELAWETSPLPYLKGVDDPYDSNAPLHTWGPLQRTRAQLTASLGTAVKGSLQAIYRVERGTSPRIVKAAIIGSSGTSYLHGSTLRAKLGLNSAWATFKSMSISPAAADKVSIVGGQSLTLSGRVYPALASGATVKLYDNDDGSWGSRAVATVRGSQALTGGYTATYSTYSITLKPKQTTRYYFLSGSAKSPTTTVTVGE